MSSRKDTSTTETSSKKNDFRKSKKDNKSNIRNARGKKAESLDYESEFNQLASGDFDFPKEFEKYTNPKKESNDFTVDEPKSEQKDTSQLEYEHEDDEEEFNDAYFEPQILR